MKSITLKISLIICAILLPVVASAQQLLDPLEVYEPVTENSFIPGARAAAMGGAQIAAGNDGYSLWYNPALLTKIRSTELSASLSHQRFANNTSLHGYDIPEARVNNTGLGGLTAAVPVPTDQGGLTVGFGVNRVRSFDRIFRYASSPDWLNNPYQNGWGGGEDESGSLWAYSIGAAVEVSPRSSIGASIDIFDGNDDYSYFFDSTYTGGSYHYNHDINDDYTGISGKVGATYNATNWLDLGLVIGLPASISIDQKSDYYESGGPNTEDHFSASYRYTLPFSFGFGAAANWRDLTVTGDISYLDYTQLKYRHGISNRSEANLTVQRYYDDPLNFSLGAEYYLRQAGVSLRAGYYQKPIPFMGLPIVKDPKFVTLGAGFLIDKTVNFDLAYLNGSYEKRDPSIGTDEEYKVQRFMMTLSYRIK
jgi:long-subunit fatty acid transport protein